MKENFYPENYPDKISGDQRILIVKPCKEYDASKDLKALVLDKREVLFTYPKEGIDIFQETVASGCPLVIQVGKPCTKKLLFFDGTLSTELERKIWDNVKDKYVNYHHHDEYSLRDALGTSKQLAQLLNAQGRKIMSITNHGSIGGWIKQNNVCKENNIKAIFGLESYQNNYRGTDQEEKVKNRKAYHLILLANNEEGFYNIIKIHNDAQLNGFYYSPRTCDDSLKKFGKGVIATSACLAGMIPKLLADGKEEEAVERYNFYKSCFDEFYIEIQLIEMEEQKEMNRKLIKFAQKVGAPLSIGIDSHYLYAENEETHSLLMCIRQKRTIHDLEQKDDDTWQFTVRNLYYRDYEQLYDLFKYGFVIDGKPVAPFEDDIFTEDIFYRACQNTRKMTICADEIKMDSSIKLPKLYDDSDTIFREMAWKGFCEKGFDKIPESNIYKERMEYELDVICLSGWADYFLISKMMVDKARELKGDWGVGLGRGCFAPWNRVIDGNKMPKFISDINEGDTVYSHDGTKNKVLKRFEYDIDEELVRIDMNDGRKITCTKDHKILTNKDGVQIWKKAEEIDYEDDIVDIF